LGIIDIGSNIAHIVVVRLERGTHLELLAGSRSTLRLVRDITRTGTLGDDTIERVVSVLDQFLRVARSAGARTIRTVATAAVREACNCNVLLSRINRQLGLDVDVLDGMREAHFGFLGRDTRPDRQTRSRCRPGRR
jgi:exopolyphosphatase/guanosine-5'-triphosphate,3'-diphosphate pyrophosphatase